MSRSSSALARRDRRGEEPLGGEAVGDPGVAVLVRSACAAWAAAAIPTGPSSALER